MHACGVVDIATGPLAHSSQRAGPTCSRTARIADRSDVVGLTAAMRSPTGLGALSRRYPHRRSIRASPNNTSSWPARPGASCRGNPSRCRGVLDVSAPRLDQLLFDIGLQSAAP